MELEEGLEAFGEINRLAQLSDGSGIIEPQFISYLDSLGDDAYDMPCLCIAGQTLLGEVLTGLGGDEHVVGILYCNIQGSVVSPEMGEEEALQVRVAQAVVVRLPRITTRMEAMKSRNVVAQQCLVSQIPPVVRVALTFTVDILDAARLDARPNDIVHVVLDYADQVLQLADDDLNAYFAELEMIVR